MKLDASPRMRCLDPFEPAALSKVALEFEQDGNPGFAALVRAAIAREVLIVFPPTRDATADPAGLLETSWPAVAFIEDDDGHATGPGGWAAAGALSAWARAAIVHAAGSDPLPFDEAVVAARLIGRSLLVYSDAAHHDAWTHFLDHVVVLSALPAEPRGGRPR